MKMSLLQNVGDVHDLDTQRSSAGLKRSDSQDAVEPTIITNTSERISPARCTKKRVSVITSTQCGMQHVWHLMKPMRRRGGEWFCLIVTMLRSLLYKIFRILSVIFNKLNKHLY